MNFTRSVRMLTLASVFLLCTAGTSHAQPTTVPTGLNPGDQYRLAFVTSRTTAATSTSIATYNSFVNGVANTVPALVALGTTWTAIGSTATVDARDNTGTNPGGGAGVPIYLLNDTKLADDNTDLWDGSVDTPPCVHENALLCPSGKLDVWTGTNVFGVAESIFPLGGARSQAMLGHGESQATTWISGGFEDFEEGLSMYAISGTLSVPTDVPSMSSWSRLLLSGTMLLGIRRFGRQR